MEIPTEMINILLCDDERKITNQLAKYINTFYKSLNKEYTITICHSGLELNKLIDQRLKMDVIFLDIDLKDCKLCLNGMPVPLLRNCYSIFNGTKYR